MQELRRWKEETSGSPELELHEQLIACQARARSNIPQPGPGMDSSRVTSLLQAGTCLLPFRSIAIGWPLLSSLCDECTGILVRFSAFPPRSEEPLRALVADHEMLRPATRKWYETGSARCEGLDRLLASALSDVLSAAMRPFLNAHAEALAPLLDQQRWRKDYCPVCGGRADLAFLDKDAANRWLLCSRCDTQWLFQRLECPYCGNQDPRSLAYFADGTGLHRLYVCDRCHSYIKALDLRQATGPLDIPAQRLLTGDMDRQALEKHYMPGWLTTPPHQAPRREPCLSA